MRTKVVEFNGFKYRIADETTSRGIARKGEYTLSATGKLFQYDSQPVLWLPGCPKVLESNDPALKGILPDLQPTIRQVWLNMNTGEFSNSWVKGEDAYVQNIVNEAIEKDVKDGWKLIEYICVNEDDFQFFNLMQIMTNVKNLSKK